MSTNAKTAYKKYIKCSTVKCNVQCLRRANTFTYLHVNIIWEKYMEQAFILKLDCEEGDEKGHDLLK